MWRIIKHLLTLSVLAMSLQTEASIKDLVDQMCDKHKATDCDLVHAIAWKESRYQNPTVYDVTSFSYGPMQIKCETARFQGLKAQLKFSCDQLENPKVSLRFAIYYLEYQLERYKGDIRKAISAYNMGTAHVCKDYNKGKCYPGEFYNYEYVNEIWRHYTWLRKKKQKRTAKFLRRYRKLDGLETFQTSTKLAYQTILEPTEESCLALNSKQLTKSQQTD